MIGDKIINYRIISLIGEGGMGSVYLGRHETLDRKVAIKVLLPELARNPEIRERFINEAKTLSKLNHQNIVTLYDFTEMNNNLYLIMEFVEGTELDTLINKVTGPIPLQRCIKIFSRILSGFEYAHSMGIVHRDIKPSNIILSPDDTPKILDFGIAKIIHGDAKLTKTGTRIGSVLYMSPEQVLGREIDSRSDIYSLGVTLFEMLSGKVPYNTTTDSEYEIQTKIVNETLPPVGSIIPHISPAIDEIISRATAKSPDYRFNNCREFSGALSLLVSEREEPHYIPPVQKTAIQQPYSHNAPQPAVKQGDKNKKTLLIILSVIAVAVIVILLFLLLKNDSGSILTDTQKKETNTPKKDKTINEGEIRNFISAWQANQNNINIQAYLAQYSSDFQGIKRTKTGKTSYLNYNEWAKDRTSMYSTAKNLYLGVSDLVVKDIDNINGTATTTFQQTYTSQKYNDEGQKIIKIRKDDNGELKIYYEEMIYSIESIGD